MSEHGPAVHGDVGNTVSGDVAGVVVQSGHIGVVNVSPPAWFVRTRYYEQIRQIAPSELVGRELELAELAEFCTAAQVEKSYRWWRAEAWAGKSALMAWFVLNPPPGIRLVSFFVTARFVGHDSRDAFVENVVEQLAALLEIPVPQLVGATTRDSQFRGLMRDAAAACERRGERLVLLVDGLDEDRGLHAGSVTHSIAALLPPDGVRVIVAGRPNPELPLDVDEDHPLRDPSVVRGLAASPAARASRSGMERELDGLLDGAPNDRDLLGLLIAARGGLSSDDLAELTDRTARQIEKRLNSVAGRSFVRRPAYWRSGTSPRDVYILGHEELMTAAARELGVTQLQMHSQRLDDWAESYRARHWPDGTPEYLLRGYFQVLRASDDTDGLVACATDIDRRRRLITVFGDAAALAEISAAHEALSRQAEPDLLSLISVRIHLEDLTDRNARLPARLPVLWARLGRVDRAETLAEGIASQERRVEALIELVRVLVATTEVPRAIELASRVPEQKSRDQVLIALVHALSTVGDIERAGRVVGMISGPVERSQAALYLATLAGRSGHVDRAEAVVHAVADGGLRVRMAMELADAVFATGDEDRARGVMRALKLSWSPRPTAKLVRQVAESSGTDEALLLLARITDPVERDKAVAAVLEAIGLNGDVDRADDVAQLGVEPEGPGLVTVALARVVAAKDLERATALIDTVHDRFLRQTAVVDLLGPLSVAGDVEKVELVVRRFLADDDSIHRLRDRLQGFLSAIKALGVVGDLARAKAMIKNPPWTRTIGNVIEASNTSVAAEAVTALAEGAYLRGDVEIAAALAEEAEQFSWTPSRSRKRDLATQSLAMMVIKLGNSERAEALADMLLSADAPDSMIASLADLLIDTANSGLVEKLARRMDHSIVDKVRILIALASRLHNEGDCDRADELVDDVRSILANGSIPFYTEVLADFAGLALTVAGPDRAWAMIEEFPRDHLRRAVTIPFLKAVASSGRTDDAARWASGLAEEALRDEAMLAVVEGAAQVGDVAQAVAVVQMIEGSGRDAALSRLARVLASFGQVDRAEALAGDIGYGQRQASTLIAIAAETDAGRRKLLLTKAMRLDGAWTDVAAALAQDDTDGVLRIVDSVVELWRARPTPPW